MSVRHNVPLYFSVQEFDNIIIRHQKKNSGSLEAKQSWFFRGSFDESMEINLKPHAIYHALVMI